MSPVLTPATHDTLGVLDWSDSMVLSDALVIDDGAGALDAASAGAASLGAAASDAATLLAATNVLKRFRDEVLADAPLFYLRLGESSGTTAADEMGAHAGTYVGAPTLGVAGLLAEDPNTAVSLNGSSQYITVADAAELDFGDVFTIEALVSLQALASQQIFSKGAGAPGLFCDTGGVLTLSKAGTGTIAQFMTGPEVGVACHVIATKSGPTVRLYFNGVDVTGSVSNQTCVSTATDVNLGRNSAGTNYLHGVLDEVAVYATALSAARAAAHYRAVVAALAAASSDSLTLNAL